MPLYAALLRGVNVGGRKLPMADLRETLVSLGYDDVVTYVQSGNAVFSTRRKATRIGPEIEERLAADFSMDVPVIVRTHAELIGTLEANPFIGHADPARLHVTFLAESPPAERLSGIESDRYAPDEWRADDRAIYLHCPEGYGETKLNNGFWERRLETVATTRELEDRREIGRAHRPGLTTGWPAAPRLSPIPC